MQRDAHISDSCALLQRDEVASTSEQKFNICENKNPTIIIEYIYEPSILASGKEETNIHEEKYTSLEDNCSKKEGDDFPKEPHSFLWPLKMDENNIQEALHLLHDTHALVSYKCWIFASLEDHASLEAKEEIQEALYTIQGDFLQLISDRDDLFELVQLLHGSSFKDEK